MTEADTPRNRTVTRSGEDIAGMILGALFVLTMLLVGVTWGEIGRRFGTDSGIEHDDVARDLIDRTVVRMVEVDFASHEHRSNIWTSGLSVTESWGTWTEGEFSEIFFHVDEDTVGMDLVIESSAFVEVENVSVQAHVYLNGVAVGAMAFSFEDRASSPKQIRFRLPDDALVVAGPNRLSFRIEGARSPESLGISTDPRVLGLGLVRAYFE